jgi:hypothetical protein
MGIALIAGLAASSALVALGDSPAAASTHTYYISSSTGSDSNSGTSSSSPWATLTKASTVTLTAGDSILLKSGDTWTGQTLTPQGSGTAADPITISSYGTGAQPAISPGIGVETYAIHLVNDGGFSISNLAISNTYGGIVYYGDGTYNHDYLSINDVNFSNITGVSTGFNTTNCGSHPNPPCYPAPDLHFGTGVSIAGLGDGADTILSDISITNSTFTDCDAGIDMPPSGTTNFGMWKNVNISDDTFDQMYRTGGVILYYVDGGVTNNITINQAGYEYGMWWGNAAFQMVGTQNYTIEGSTFENTGRPNSTPDGEGLDFESDNQNVTVRNNVIENNAGPALLFAGNNGDWPGQNSNLVVENNILKDNNSTDYNGDIVFLNASDGATGGANESAGVLRNNSIYLEDDAQSYASGSVIFDGTNTVYNSESTVVFAGPQTTVDDNSGSFSYSGSWPTGSASDCYDGSNHYSSTTGATYTVTFTGTRAVLFASLAPENGIAGVSVDGGAVQDVDFYGPLFECQEPVFQTAVLSSGTHTITVTVTGTKDANSSGYYVSADRLDSYSGTSTDDSNFSYTGSWSTGSNSSCYMGSNHFSATAGNTYQVSFEGSQATLFASVGTENGIAGISVDGGPETYVDTYNSSYDCSTPVFVTPQLVNGEHTITVEVTGYENAASSGANIGANRLEVATATTDTAGDSTFAYVGTGWTRAVGSGCYLGANTYSQTTNDYYSVNFTGTQVALYASYYSSNGIAGISIDGSTETDVDFYGPTFSCDQLVWTSPVLTRGNHTLKVRVTGTKDSSSAGYIVSANKVIVTP